MWFAALLTLWTSQGQAYVEAPYSLGRVLSESTNVLVVEVTRVDKAKGLVIYKKVQDIKGKHPKDDVKHNIGKRGFHPRESETIMNWAEVGKRAIVFHNGGASETCIGGYWYQCYAEGEWWGMTHAEPYMLRTFTGDCDKLAAAVKEMHAGKEVQVTCFADEKRDDLHVRKGKLQTVWASLKRIEWNPKRDFVGWGGEGGEIQEFKTVNLLPEGAADWRFLPEMNLNDKSLNWTQPGFDDAKWRLGKAPIGYGEPEIDKRKGTTVAEKGRNFVFRKTFNVPAELLTQKGVIFRLSVASDDTATVWINSQVADRDPVDDHEFAYWNREVDLNPALFRSGPNVVTVLVKNREGSSDLYLDMDISAVIPLPPKKLKK